MLPVNSTGCSVKFDNPSTGR